MTEAKDSTKVILFVNQKGGVGKTTFTTNLAAELAGQGENVVLFDTDPQKSSQKWFLVRKNYEELGPEPLTLQTRDYSDLGKELKGVGVVKAVLADLTKLAEGADYVFIDTPGKLDAGVRALMAFADLIIIPITPGQHDFRAMEKTAEEVSTSLSLAEINDRTIQVRILINESQRTNTSKETKQGLERFNFPIFETVVSKRAAWNETGCGLTVREIGKNREAITELDNLLLEIKNII